MISKSAKDIRRAASVFDALGSETRLRIVLFIGDGERCACEIPQAVKRAQPTVSLNLKILRDAGVIKSRREGKKILYSLSSAPILKIIGECEKIKLNSRP
jgi:DNA-binding transcriptional ArsR family regulator